MVKIETVQRAQTQIAQIKIQAITRVDRAMLELKAQGTISHFETGGWRGDELLVTASLPMEKYTYEIRMAVRDQMGTLLQSLGLHVDLTLSSGTDAFDDEGA